MTNPIRQMQLQFDPLHDRLLFRLNTLDKSEYRLWFTRRYCKILWQALVQLIETQYIPPHSDPQTKSTLFSFQHEHAVSQTDFGTSYQEDSVKHPLGIEPILVSRVTIKNSTDGNSILCLHPDTGAGIEIKLDSKMLHSLLKLLSEAVKSSDWELNFTLSDEQIPSSSTLN